MRLETTVEIDAPPEQVWAILCDVERWPEWTSTVTSAKRLDAGDLAPGSKVRLKQPKLLPAVWEITELEPAASFNWTTKAPGVTTVAEHWLEAIADTGMAATTSTDDATGSGTATRTRVHGVLTQSGPLASLLRPVLTRLTQRYLDIETAGLKQHAEASV